MLNIQNIRFFDKEGIDMNLGLTSSEITAVYDNSTQTLLSNDGNVFFPRVSVNLIESQQIYILQEVTGPTSSYVLRNIPGSVTITNGSDIITGTNTSFTDLEAGYTIKILSTDYVIDSITSDTEMTMTSSASETATTTNIYYYDYLSYNEPRSTPGISKQYLTARFEDEDQTEFFLYDINYTEDVPFIEKSYALRKELTNGYSDNIDSLTGRIIVSEANTIPIQINLGIRATVEDNYETNVIFEIENQYLLDLSSSPIIQSDGSIVIFTSGTASLSEVYNTSTFTFQGLTGATAFYEVALTPISIGVTGSNMFTVFKHAEVPGSIGATALSMYKLLMKNVQPLSTMTLYGETEAEDERFRLVLENFGKKIDFNKEYIFRDSDISEALPDYELLNKKRKELLLEGDSIYSTMGSYKSLINVINYFGYYDLDIKEYFLNIDEDSSNYGKYTQVLIPRNAEERDRIKSAWELVPSNVYKKTSKFGLFYNLNEMTGEYDDYGTPIVEDSFMFSPEEVLIKLFGLKELLKEKFLPLNARIVDITGEGIYFQRIRLDAWADNLDYRTINLGTQPRVSILPKRSYISDLRRIDQYYVEKFTEQGLNGFLGASATDPSMIMSSTEVILPVKGDSLISYDNYVQPIYDVDGNEIAPIDTMWNFMPPGIYDSNFNEVARRLLPLADSDKAVAGAPILIESEFDLTWEDCDFTWAHLGILGPTGAPLNINLWTWNNIARGEYIDVRWTVELLDKPGFKYDSDRRPIGEYEELVRGATVNGIPAVLSAVITGDTLTNIDIINSGFGYTTTPSISISGPGGTGTAATASCEIVGGYVTGLTFSGGSGYSESSPPVITIDGPVPTYETEAKVLHAVSLPYPGEYQVGIFLYDITNNFTVQYQKHIVNSKNADFVSVHVKETPERKYEEFEDITWDEVTGPWYYPNHIESKWEDAKITWNSLEFNSYKDQTLYTESLDTSILEINRSAGYVILENNLSHYLKKGNQLFFTRESSDVIQQNISIPSGAIVRNATTLKIPYAGDINVGTRIIITDASDYNSIDPSVNFYSYVDVVSTDGTWITVYGLSMQTLYDRSLTDNLYMTWGIYSGTYGIEIQYVSITTENNTKVKLVSNAEIYNIDGNFDVTDVTYDIDYAETKLGVPSMNYENAEEVKWNEIEATWMGLEYHAGTDCGFIIPFILHGGSITIDEHETFDFSGSISIDSTYDGLLAGMNELNASTNEGISKYTYSVLPDVPLTMTGSGGAITASAIYGATAISVTAEPITGIPGIVWTGYEWLTVDSYNSGKLILNSSNTVKYPFNNATILLPYTYHTQLTDKNKFNQFYYFIQGKAKNPSSEMLSIVNFRNGVRSEWKQNPDRTNTYPLKNTFVQGLTGGDDYLYDKWIYGGRDYPPNFIAPDYSSNLKSVESRISYDKTLNSAFSYIDTIITDEQQEVSQYTPVMFNYDASGVPGKTNPKWTVTCDNDGEIHVVSTSTNLLWNFSRPGCYSVTLDFEDRNGNKISGTKTSFIKVKGDYAAKKNKPIVTVFEGESETLVLSEGESVLTDTFDFAVVRYIWTPDSGADLDTRTRFENIGDPLVDGDEVGYGQGYYVINDTDKRYLHWGGDNTSAGREAVLIDFKKISEAYPDNISFNVFLSAFWWNARLSGDIILEFELYKGGSMSKSGYDFINTGGEIVSTIRLEKNVTYERLVLGVPPTRGTDTLGTILYFPSTKTAKLM